METDRNESHRVDVWHIDLDAGQDQSSRTQVLSEDEWERARRFHSPLHTRRFVACRAALRRIVADEIGAEPNTICFYYGPCGKPGLDDNPCDVRFNVSHAEGQAVIAVGRHFDLGVDIAPLHPVNNCEDLARLVFSEVELRELEGAHDKSRAFLNGWTRKEAYVKALGRGFSEPLQSFSVSLLGRAALVAASPCGGSVKGWTLLDVDCEAHVVALAARVPHVSVRVHSSLLT